MPDPKETLLYILGSQEFEEFYRKYIAAGKDNPARKEEGMSADLLESYLEKIKNPECYVSVLGIQGSGKSSLLNALVFGDEVLPVEVEETTCIPTLIRRVYKGEKLGAEVHFEDGRVEDMPLKRSFLEKIVDNRYNPANILKASYVLCRLPASLLDEGFVFVDLPGVGSLTETNEQATMSFLRETHIGVFLLRTVPPITESEAAFIRTAWPMVQQSLFVQNLWAQETEEEVKEGMKHNETVLAEIAAQKQTAPPRSIIPINIAMACQGSFTKNKEIMGLSGMEQLEQKIREFANISFLRLFYRNTGLFFTRLVQRARQRIEERMAILRVDQEEIRERFEEQKEKYLKNKEDLQGKVASHLEDFLQKISSLKTDWLPEHLEQASELTFAKIDKSPIEDLKEQGFRDLVRQIISDQFHIVCQELQRELANTAENYADNLSSTLHEMASLDKMVEEVCPADKAKDPKAARGWSVALTGSIAPIVSYAGLMAGPAGWTIFGGALLASGIVRWISGATAHKRIMRGLRKAIGDARGQIRKQIADEIDDFARKISDAIRAAVQNELLSYEDELERIDRDLNQELSEREVVKADLEKDAKQASVFLKTLEYVK